MRGSAAEQYHGLTKYTEESVRSGPGLDWTKQPDQYKDIVSSHRVSLRSYMQAGDTEAPIDLGLARLGRLLFYANGVTGVIRYRGGGNQFLRASPSAGALYPTEIYVALKDGPEAEPGLYNYQVRSNELVRLWEGDMLEDIRRACGDHGVFDNACCCLLLSGVYWRSAWRYQERGYRRVLLDTGHVLGNLTAYAPHESCAPYPILGFHDSLLNGLFFFDDAVEGVLAAVPMLDGGAPDGSAPLWRSGPVGTPALAAQTIETEHDLSASAAIALHRASASGDPGPASLTPAAAPISPDAIPLDPPQSLNDQIPDAIVQRRSARGYTGESMTLEELGRALGYAFGRDSGPVYGTRTAGRMRAHLIAHSVRGLEPGIYVVEGEGAALQRLARSDLREPLFRAALDQEIARSCSAVLVLTAPADSSIELWGDRAYRNLHLEAGILGERLQLGAQALGLGACGIGGFLDDDISDLVGAPPEDFVLYLVTIGHT
ncbi:MAG: SagB/ThcOx family dehydrogenase [Planctomycetota bacterium]